MKVYISIVCGSGGISLHAQTAETRPFLLFGAGNEATHRGDYACTFFSYCDLSLQGKFDKLFVYCTLTECLNDIKEVFFLYIQCEHTLCIICYL